MILFCRQFGENRFDLFTQPNKKGKGSGVDIHGKCTVYELTDSLIEICKKRHAWSECFFYYDWDFNWNFFKGDLFRCQPVTIDLKTLLAYQSYFIVRIELINFILPNVNSFCLN